MVRYEIIIYWSAEDESFIAEVPELPGAMAYGASRSETLAAVDRAVRAAGVRAPRLLVEPGKFLVADAGALLLGVSYVKTSYGNVFACVDGGTFNTVPRPAIYAKAYHHVVNASRLGSGRSVPVTVAGHLCETGDVFGKDIPMPLPRAGDILAVLCAGAYARSMASNFNLRPIPGEVLL